MAIDNSLTNMRHKKLFPNNYSRALCVSQEKKKYLIELKITGQDKHQNLVIQLLFTTY